MSRLIRYALQTATKEYIEDGHLPDDIKDIAASGGISAGGIKDVMAAGVLAKLAKNPGDRDALIINQRTRLR